MKKSKSKILRSVDDVKSTRNALLGINGILAAGMLTLGFGLISQSTEVVVTPPDFNEELVVAGNVANEHYKVRWAFASASIAGNLTPRNVDFVLEQLNSMFTPYLRENVLPQIRREAHVLQARGASQTFVIEDAIYDPVKDLIWIYGNRAIEVRGASKNEVVVPQRWTYEFRIAPFSGRPAITHFNSYSGLPRNRDHKYEVEPNPTLDSQISQVVSEP
jgi:conjugal transfer pilus assembly protein TraE